VGRWDGGTVGRWGGGASEFRAREFFVSCWLLVVRCWWEGGLECWNTGILEYWDGGRSQVSIPLPHPSILPSFHHSFARNSFARNSFAPSPPLGRRALRSLGWYTPLIESPWFGWFRLGAGSCWSTYRTAGPCCLSDFRGASVLDECLFDGPVTLVVRVFQFPVRMVVFAVLADGRCFFPKVS
jgi:hypothetical protein